MPVGYMDQPRTGQVRQPRTLHRRHRAATTASRHTRGGRCPSGRRPSSRRQRHIRYRSRTPALLVSRDLDTRLGRRGECGRAARGRTWATSVGGERGARPDGVSPCAVGRLVGARSRRPKPTFGVRPHLPGRRGPGPPGAPVPPPTSAPAATRAHGQRNPRSCWEPWHEGLPLALNGRRAEMTLRGRSAV
jgi:hypothetical protein